MIWQASLATIGSLRDKAQLNKVEGCGNGLGIRCDETCRLFLSNDIKNTIYEFPGQTIWKHYTRSLREVVSDSYGSSERVPIRYAAFSKKCARHN
jgi:hypothetical protein